MLLPLVNVLEGGWGGDRGLLCSIQSTVFILTHLFLPQLLRLSIDAFSDTFYAHINMIELVKV